MPANFYKYKFVLTGGGTGGHIIPLVAMAVYLQEYPVEVLYIGESGGREERIAMNNNIKFQGIMAGKMRRYFDLEAFINNFIDFFKIIIGTLQSFVYLSRFKPNAILSKGGYVSLPVVLAGRFLKIPVLIHESDIEMGLTNKMSMEYAQVIATGFPIEYYNYQGKAKMVFTGVPIEKDFFSPNPEPADWEHFGFNSEKPTILVTGGIQGAHAINEKIKKILPKLLKHTQVIHLCGEQDYPVFKELKEKLEEGKTKYQPFPTLGKDRVAAMRIANLVISRSSATTLAELAALAKPVILIPLPSAASDHQLKNAKIFESQGAAVIMQEADLTENNLYETINSLIDDKNKLVSMGKGMLKFSKPEAGKLLTEELIQMIHQ